jgi:hypothetical protein
MPEQKIKISGDNSDFLSKLAQAKTKIKQTFQGASIGGMGSFLTASIWGAVATAAYKVTQSIGATISEFRELRSEAMAIGTTTAEMARLSDMAVFSGTKLSDMTAVLGKMRDLQIQAANGSVQAATALAALGLSAEKVASMSPAEQLRAVSAALEAITDPAQRAAVSLAIFGKMPEEVNALAKAFQGLQLEILSKHLDQVSKGWDLVAGNIKQATKAAFAFGGIMMTLRQLGNFKDFLEGGKGEKVGAAQPAQATAAAQVAKGFAGVQTMAQQQLPVDQFRRIGAAWPGMGLGGMAPAEEQVQVSKEIRDHVMKVYEAMKSMDEKTPAPEGKY